jgi:hypothetical protein
MVLNKNYFATAAVITAVIFLLGFVLGLQLDFIKSEGIQDEYKQTELDWYDIQLKSDYYQTYPNIDGYCDIMIQSNLDFSDKIYSQGLQIEQYEEQTKIMPELYQRKREYALLKFQFWLDAVKLRSYCDAEYNTLVYFYNDDSTGLEEVYQRAQSNILLELKQEYGPNLILVPLPIDLNIESINLLVEQFNIKETTTIVINEKIVLEGVMSKQKITQELNKASINTVA